MISKAGPPFHGGSAKADEMNSVQRDAVRMRDFRFFILLVSEPRIWPLGTKLGYGVFSVEALCGELRLVAVGRGLAGTMSE